MAARPQRSHADPLPFLAVDDPRKVVKVVASDGKTGEQKDLSYTNCKVVGNGSFGIVFQARLLDEPGNQDVAIKKVLQDKRFKVRGFVSRSFADRKGSLLLCGLSGGVDDPFISPNRTVNCKSCALYPIRTWSTSKHSSILMATR